MTKFKVTRTARILILTLLPAPTVIEGVMVGLPVTMLEREPEPEYMELIDGFDALIVVFGIPHPAQQVEHAATADPLRLSCVDGDPVPDAAVTVVRMVV